MSDDDWGSENLLEDSAAGGAGDEGPDIPNLRSAMPSFLPSFDDWLQRNGTRIMFVADPGAGTTSVWWCYRQPEGYWRPIAKNDVRQIVTKWWDGTTEALRTKLRMQDRILIRREEMADALALLEIQYGRSGPAANRDLYDCPHPCVLIPAGPDAAGEDLLTLDLGAGQIVANDPDLFLTERHRIAAHWDPAALCPRFQAALDVTMSHVPAGADRAQHIQFIWEWMASFLIRGFRPRDLCKALVMVGDKRTGKSTILDALTTVLGFDRVSRAGLETLANPHGTQALEHKMGWLIDEVPPGTIVRHDILNRLITDQPETINPKFQAPRNVQLGLTIGIAVNVLPRIHDASGGIWDRLIIMPMRTTFDGANGNPAPIADFQQLVQDEAAGILQEMLRALFRLAQRGHFDVPAALVAHTARVQIESDPFREFLSLAFVRATDPKAFVMHADIVAALQGWLKDIQATEDLAKQTKGQISVLKALIGSMFAADQRLDMAPGGRGHWNYPVKPVAPARYYTGIAPTDYGALLIHQGYDLQGIKPPKGFTPVQYQQLTLV